VTRLKTRQYRRNKIITSDVNSYLLKPIAFPKAFAKDGNKARVISLRRILNFWFWNWDDVGNLPDK
jgi:hypothetical protein